MKEPRIPDLAPEAAVGGPIALFDVEAAVARPGRLKTPLLGMTFIDRLDETTFSRGRLILKN